MIQRKRQKVKTKPTCSVCMYPIDKVKSCFKCREPFHPSCIKDYCIECQEDIQQFTEESDSIEDICVLCDGDCTCNQKEPELSDAVSSSSNELASMIDYEADRFYVQDELVTDVDDSSSESVYEEPETEMSDEDIMVEIVREKLLNGWSSEDEEGDFSDIESIGDAPVAEIEMIAVVEPTKVEEKPPTPVTVKMQETKKVEPIKIHTERLEPKPEKKQKVSLQSAEPPKLNIPAVNPNVNPWIALAALNMNSGFINQYQKPKNDHAQTMATAAALASNLLKKPVVNMNSVATAAAALMASPAAMRAFSDMRKRELDKMMESISIHTKGRVDLAGLQPGSSSHNDQKVSISLTKESSSKDEVKDFALEDILDHGQFDESVQSPVSEDEYQKFRRIPIGTYWNSQRKKKRPKNFHKALKKSTTNKLLESTLLETLPMKKKKKEAEVMDFSPMFGPLETKNPSSFFL